MSGPSVLGKIDVFRLSPADAGSVIVVTQLTFVIDFHMDEKLCFGKRLVNWTQLPGGNRGLVVSSSRLALTWSGFDSHSTCNFSSLYFKM